MKIKKTKITDTPSGSLVPLNSKGIENKEMEVFCYNLIIRGIPENIIYEEFYKKFPKGDFSKHIKQTYKVFQAFAAQDEDVAVGKAMAQLEYQLGKASSAGDINASINAIKARTELFRKYKEKKISDEKDLTDYRPNWL
jgi:hypothetical protein